MAGTYPYTPNPANVSRFLDHIKSAGVPSKVTQNYLASVGFKSSNDRYLIRVLRFLGLIDSSGKPTDAWREFRDTARGPATLANLLRENYKELFEAYPDAYDRPQDVLRDFFATKTDVAESTLGRIVSTFQNIAEAADFSGSPGRLTTTRLRVANRSRVAVHDDPVATDPGAGMRPAQVYQAPGILIRIDPTPDNVRRGLRFLQIFLDDSSESRGLTDRARPENKPVVDSEGGSGN